MTDLFQRCAEKIQNRQLLKRGEKILVAVSGGADSLVLLHILNALAQKFQWQIRVAHFDHQLRGRASDADKKLVRQTAKKWRLRVYTGSANVKKIAGESKISIEMAARTLRHNFFARIAEKLNIKKIALAHHADDQVELFFLRLLRGAGGEGLAGMKDISPSSADKTISLIRPLLDFSKKEILEFARDHKIKFREDATNLSNDFLRNRIRNELLPLLQKNYQPAIAKTVLRVMEIAGSESEFISETARQWLAWPHGVFEKLPVAIQRKMVHQQFLELGIRADFDWIETLRAAPNQVVSVNPEFNLVRFQNGKIHQRKQSAQKFLDDELKLNLASEKFQSAKTKPNRTNFSTVVFGGSKFRWKILSRNPSAIPEKQIGREIFDADKVGDEIILRHWRAGDRFQPIGFASPVKLQDLFVNAKIPAAQRPVLILATTLAGEIFWVESLRISENFKLTGATRRRLVWHWRKLS